MDEFVKHAEDSDEHAGFSQPVADDLSGTASFTHFGVSRVARNRHGVARALPAAQPPSSTGVMTMSGRLLPKWPEE